VDDWTANKLVGLVVAYGDARATRQDARAAAELVAIRNLIGHPEGEQQDSSGRMFREIVSTDVRKTTFRAFGRNWPVVDFMGQILPLDVGKRVYLCTTNAGDSQFLQVESTSQRDARVGNNMR
jgi:hypothetical protein